MITLYIKLNRADLCDEKLSVFFPRLVQLGRVSSAVSACCFSSLLREASRATASGYLAVVV